MENLRYSDSGGRLGSAHIYSDARSSLLPLPLIPTSPSTMLSCFCRRRHTSNTHGLGELGPSRHRLSFTEIPLQVSLDVISRRLCQPPRRVLDMVVVPAGERLFHFFRRVLTASQGLQNAKSTPIVPRFAPVPLGDRCDTGFWWAGGDKRRGAPLRYVCRRLRRTLTSFPTLSQTFLRHGKGGIPANRRQTR